MGSAADPETLQGTVIRRSSRMAWVDTGREVLSCDFRGRLRQEVPCVAGDRVRVKPTGPGSGVVWEVLPRRTLLRRGVITGSRGEGRVTAANLDRVAVVVSARSPPPRWGLVDRLLVEAGRDGLTSFLVVNKIDLVPGGTPEFLELGEALEAYRAARVQVLMVSAVSGAGLRELEAELKSSVTVFSGHSGVGKTALLNALVPGAEHPTREVNPYTGKGRHTTTSVVLVRLPEGGYIMDTPGFKEFALLGLPPPELGRWYPEFQEAISACRFKDCLHREEPACALREMVSEGKISKLRYQNYLQILSTLLDKKINKSPRRSARSGPPEAS